MLTTMETSVKNLIALGSFIPIHRCVLDMVPAIRQMNVNAAVTYTRDQTALFMFVMGETLQIL